MRSPKLPPNPKRIIKTIFNHFSNILARENCFAFKVRRVKLTVNAVKLKDKTDWDQLTELQKIRLVKAIREEREKALKQEKRQNRMLGRADGPEWVRRGLLVAKVAARGYNRKLVSEVVEELFYVEDGIVMGERREPACWRV